MGAVPTDLRQQVLRRRKHLHHREELLPRLAILQRRVLRGGLQVHWRLLLQVITRLWQCAPCLINHVAS